MDDELAILKKKKLDELKKQYYTEGKNMEIEMPDSPIEINDAELTNTIGKYKTVVIDCWAPWCGPCRMIHPILNELAKEMKGQIVFGKLNVDENQQTSAQYGIMSIPTLLVFKDGKLVDKIIGALPKPMLKTKLETYI